MPTYEYECKSCGHTFEAFQSMSDEPIKICPQCGKDVRRLINGGSGIIFKGSGFYVTDKKGGSSSIGGKSAGSTSGAAAGSGGAESGAAGNSGGDTGGSAGNSGSGGPSSAGSGASAGTSDSGTKQAAG